MWHEQIQPYGDKNGECGRLLTELGSMISDRGDLVKKWDEEEAVEVKKKPTADEEVKAAIAANHKPRWQAKDRPFLRKLADKSLQVAEDCGKRGESSLKDLFLGQASRIEAELKQLESVHGKYEEPVEAPAPKKRKKVKRKKR